MPAGTTVIDNGTIITMGPAGVISAGAVAVEAGGVVAVGPSREIRERFPHADFVDVDGGIVIPGLVNSHTHLAMTMFRGLVDDLDLQSFLARILPTEAAVLTAERVRIAATIAVAESLLGGVTAALDMYWFHEVAFDVAESLGLRLHAGPVFIEGNGCDDRPLAERMPWADRLLGHPRVGIGSDRWVFPHGTYTLELADLAAVRALADRHGASVHIHAAENAGELAAVAARHGGRRPVAVLDEVGLLRPGTVLAHAVLLDDDEIARLAATGTAVAHCPVSNMKLASGVARVPELLAAGVTVGLGSDGCATSNDLDIFLAMRSAAVIHKARTGDPTAVTAAQSLHMATVGGASLLGRATLRFVEPGKRADLVVLRNDRPHLVPVYDPVSSVVYAAGRGDVRHVMVEGRMVVRDGVLAGVDLAAAIEEMRGLAAFIANRSGATAPSSP